IYRLLPKDQPSVLVTFSDAEFVGALYGKHVLGMGPQAVIIHPAMWGHVSFRRRALSELGLTSSEWKNRQWEEVIEAVSGHIPVFVWGQDESMKEEWTERLVHRVRLMELLRDKPSLERQKAIAEKDIRALAFQMERPAFRSDPGPWEAMLASRYEPWFQAL